MLLLLNMLRSLGLNKAPLLPSGCKFVFYRYCLLSERRLKAAVTIDGFRRAMPPRDENVLKSSVLKQPVTAVINCAKPGRNYEGGLVRYNSNEDDGGGLGHNVVIVGYGTTDDGVDYWLGRSHWGARWGEGGYFRLQRNVPNPIGAYGIARRCNYPVINGFNN